MIFFFAGEDRGHFEAGSSVALRVLKSSVGWFEDTPVAWRGPEADHQWFKFKDAMSLARAAGIQTTGGFGGGAREFEVRAYRAMMLLWKKLAEDLGRRGEDVVAGFILRDEDGEPRRRAGAEQARSTVSLRFKLALGFCVPEVESWYLCGLEPEDDAERARLDALRRRLGFDPRRSSERLTSTARGSERDAKKILKGLIGEVPERRARCLDLPVEHLRERGATSGLKDFVAEVEAEIVPALNSGHVRR
ncbi:MAG: hypothetical protein IPK80_28400 [Nannocystis sp.]|nr:hypothetical protein [Nannocystis sp.]